MIERHWKGIAKRERASEYIAHLQNETFLQIVTISGFRSAKILKREIKAGVQFLIITEWENLDAIKSFAGPNIGKAVVPKLVQDMMMQYDDTVSHYEVYYKTKAGQKMKRKATNS